MLQSDDVMVPSMNRESPQKLKMFVAEEICWTLMS